MCALMLMHGIAHEGCTDTVRESALKVDSGRKIPRHSMESSLPQRCAGLTHYHLSYILSPHLITTEQIRLRVDKCMSHNRGSNCHAVYSKHEHTGIPKGTPISTHKRKLCRELHDISPPPPPPKLIWFNTRVHEEWYWKKGLTTSIWYNAS